MTPPLTWQVSAATGISATDMCWSPELGLYLAVCGVDNTPTNYVYTSPDGETWTPTLAGTTNYWNGCCWSPELGRFVIVGSNPTTSTNMAMYSIDGITWEAAVTPSRSFRCVTWAAELGLFVACASTTSTSAVMTSPDGATWTTRTTPSQGSWEAVCWSPELGRLVAVSSASTLGVGRIMTSTNGTSWTAIAQGGTNYWRDIAWSAVLGRFVAVGSLNNSGPDAVVTSPDGLTWTSHASKLAADSVVWVPEAALFVAVGTLLRVAGVSSTYGAAYSADGIDWVESTLALSTWKSLVYAPAQGQLVAGAYLPNEQASFAYANVLPPVSVDPFWTNRVRTAETV